MFKMVTIGIASRQGCLWDLQGQMIKRAKNSNCQQSCKSEENMAHAVKDYLLEGDSGKKSTPVWLNGQAPGAHKGVQNLGGVGEVRLIRLLTKVINPSAETWKMRGVGQVPGGTEERGYDVEQA